MKTTFEYGYSKITLRYHRRFPRVPTTDGFCRLLSYRRERISDDSTWNLFLLEKAKLSSCRNIFVQDGMIIKLSEDMGYWQNLSEWEVLRNKEFREACRDNGILIPRPIHMDDDAHVVVSEYIEGIVRPYSTDNDAITARAIKIENYLRNEWNWGDSHGANWGYRPENDKFYLLDLGSFGHLCG